LAEDNPLLQPWEGPLGTPPFDRIRPEQFCPPFAAAIAEHEAEMAVIRDDPVAPNFDNVLAAMERAGATLGRVRRLFWTLSSAEAEPGIHAIEAEVSALLTRHGTALAHDAAVFAKVAAVHAGMDAAGLSPEQRRLAETVHRGFVRGGAALDDAAKHRLAAIDERLAALSVAFGQNVLAATAAWSVTVDADALAGLPEALCAAAKARADAAGRGGRYMFGADRGTDGSGADLCRGPIPARTDLARLSRSAARAVSTIPAADRRDAAPAHRTRAPARLCLPLPIMRWPTAWRRRRMRPRRC
jgi:peptidyl-dipeptidase Dcp